MKEVIKYVHEDVAHNLNDPKIIVPVLMKIFNPTSVVDVGCGIGTFLNVFEKEGVKKILGLDGYWVNKEKLSSYISLSNFRETDLENDFIVNEKFDLAICLEVVEHLSEKSSDTIIKNLTKLSDFIVFSAAIPGQGGQNHINEQWPDYWDKKFSKYDYVLLDPFRSIFWNNQDLARWYKQNLFLAVKKGKESIINEFDTKLDNSILNLVHPEYYKIRLNEINEFSKLNNDLNKQINKITSGQAGLNFYIKLVLKVFIRPFKKKKI